MIRKLEYVEIDEPGLDPTDNHWTLRVRKGDFSRLRDAIAWYVGETLAIPIAIYHFDPTINKSVPVDLNNPEVLEFKVCWRLRPPLDADGLHEIVETYKLLKDHYASWPEVLKSQQEITDPLENATMALLGEKVKTKLPPWAQKVRKIREATMSK